MSRILVIGSVNLDLSARVAELPKPGETITGATLARFPGGKGANQALAARRLGAEVTLIACVGRDANADEALRLLREGGVDLAHCIVHPEAPTGVALIAVADSGENQIVVAPGANAALSLDGIELPAADALVCQLEVPAAVITAAQRRFDGLVCVNLAPARDVDDEIIACADVVVVNETEAAFYGERLARCRGYVATTRGKAGAELCSNGEIVATSGVPKVDVVDTVGAGDAFTAALAVALAEGQAPEAALRFACTAGSLTATRRGAQPALPSREDVERLLS